MLKLIISNLEFLFFIKQWSFGLHSVPATFFILEPVKFPVPSAGFTVVTSQHTTMIMFCLHQNHQLKNESTSQPDVLSVSCETIS